MPITMTRARDLRPRDVFSTDGAVVLSVGRVGMGKVRPNDPPAIYITAICHGVEKTAWLSPDQLLPIWTADETL